MNPCPYCRNPLPPSRRVHCGDLTCKRAYNAERGRKWQRDFREKSGRWVNAKYRPRKSNTECVDCGAPVAHGRTEETRCRACGKRAYYERQAAEARERRERELAEYFSRPARALRDLARAAEGVSRGWVFVSGPCHSCGEVFTCQQMNDPAKFCSKTCARREAKAIRRARQKAVRISPGRRHAVFVRDNWTCRICGDPVNRAAQVPDLDAPVVDHRIPLARGGAHGPENWQTAHFYCNSVKCDQLDYDFAEEAG